MTNFIFNKLHQQRRHPQLFEGTLDGPAPEPVKQSNTLAGLKKFGLKLRVECVQCHTQGRAGGIDGLDEATPLKALEFTCSKCGSTNTIQDVGSNVDKLVVFALNRIKTPQELENFRREQERKAFKPRKIDESIDVIEESLDEDLDELEQVLNNEIKRSSVEPFDKESLEVLQDMNVPNDKNATDDIETLPKTVKKSKKNKK